MAPGVDGGCFEVMQPFKKPQARSARFRFASIRLISLLWLPALIFMGLFYFFPLGNILYTSLLRGEAGLGAPFIQVFTSESVRNVFVFTIWQAFLSTLLTLLVGLPGAYLLARFNFRGKSLIMALTGIPFVLPTLVVATAFNALLGPRGWVNSSLMTIFDQSQPPIQFIHTFTAILVAHVFYNTTIVLRMVSGFWANLDPRMTQAAQVLGANLWQTLRHVTAPLLSPVIATAALLVFIFDFTSFGVILVLGGPRFATLEVEIYYQTISLFNLPLAAALSVLQIGCTLGFTVIYTRMVGRLSRPVSLRPRAFTQRRLTSIRERVVAAVIISQLLSLLTVPLVALATRSIMSIDLASGSNTASTNLSLNFYRELTINRHDSLFFVPPTRAIATSIIYASITVFLAVLLGFPASWLLARNHESPLSRMFDSILMLPLGTSAVTLGLGFIVALDQPPLDLRASPLLIPIAHTLVAFPFVVRSLLPALRSIQPRLRYAAAVLGASPRQITRHVDVPMIARAIMVASTFAFSISLGEFGATALISRPEYPTIPIMIYRFISQPGALNYGQALALSTLLMIFTGVGMLAIERFRFADIGEF